MPIVKRHLFIKYFSILQITEKLRDKNFTLALSVNVLSFVDNKGNALLKMRTEPGCI